GHCLDPASHWHFADHDWRLANESLVKTCLPNVFFTINGSSTVRGSPPTVRLSSAGAAGSFKIIPPL
ncbi:hypothetical protein HAX54_049858, partial [Datura stramonium]|nr:hypothetical protein [Datura stramonium]